MKNIKADIKGNILTLEIDLEQDFGPSSTGKTQVVASSEGPIKLGPPHEGIQYNLNVNRKG